MVRALSRRFERIVVFSGAGMSADSGIPTFRGGSNGLWQAFNPEELATPSAWRRNRDLVWGWYEWRRGLVAAAEPNPGHLAVASMQRQFGATIITQNVDDLHERGGARDVLHLHGSLFAARCDTCSRAYSLGEAPQEAQREREPPRCDRCGGHIRPGVVWFGEGLDDGTVTLASRAIAACDLLLIVGTSGVVYPAAGMVGLAPRDAVIIEVNPQPSMSSPATDRIHKWPTTAALGLPQILQQLCRDSTSGGDERSDLK
ncbi:MAG: NAD-dependent deacylase [Polyangiaceae bacterium]|nr:NAD-dependent deacylase [Polyangiaceae bacterium]MCW5790454.1 NAD-dependent deacylase [Polyangiaceae bacterium]